jgi:hypothetical protein
MKNVHKCFTDLLCPQPLSKKIKLRAYRYRVFLQQTPHDRNLPQGELLSRSNSFFLFKGPGPFKKSFKKCGNVENLKAYRLIPPMTPLFNGWTIPLNEKNALGIKFQMGSIL